MSDGALVSVIIPVFDGEKYLAEAIESVLCQTYREFELLVVDDGSTDASAAIARGFEAIHYHHQAHAGLSVALNTGVALATGDFLSFLDADDLWVDTKLEEQLAMFGHNPALDAVFGLVKSFRSYNDATATPADRILASEEVPGYCKGTMLIRRVAFQSVGGFAPELRRGEFIDWYARAVERGLRTAMISRVLLHRRLHDGNMGLRDMSARRDYVLLAKAALDRRRRAGLPRSSQSEEAG